MSGLPDLIVEVREAKKACAAAQGRLKAALQALSAYSAENQTARRGLTDEEAADAADQWGNGATHREIGAQYGYPPQTICAVVSRFLGRYAPPEIKRWRAYDPLIIALGKNDEVARRRVALIAAERFRGGEPPWQGHAGRYYDGRDNR